MIFDLPEITRVMTFAQDQVLLFFKNKGFCFERFDLVLKGFSSFRYYLQFNTSKIKSNIILVLEK